MYGNFFAISSLNGLFFLDKLQFVDVFYDFKIIYIK